MQCPTLAKVPSINHDLTLKATLTGVTILKKIRYRTRYTGSKYSAVDINGKLYKERKELEDVLSVGKEEQKKIPATATSQRETLLVNAMQNSNIFSTLPSELSPVTGEVIPNEPKLKSYKLNKKEVRQRLLGYINTHKGKKELYFWTVTFPGGTPDDMCYRIFNIWLTSLRKYKMLKGYLWVAERQPLKTHTIHFHIAIPHKMPVQRANAMMRGTLKTFAKRGEIPFTMAACAKYNGVDIAKDRKTKRVINFAIKKGSRALSNYLTKYVTKNDGNFTHLAWHNSREFSCLFTGVTFTIGEFKKFGFGFFLNRTRIFDSEYAQFIPWLEFPPPLLEEHLYQLNSYLQLNPN